MGRLLSVSMVPSEEGLCVTNVSTVFDVSMDVAIEVSSAAEDCDSASVSIALALSLPSIDPVTVGGIEEELYVSRDVGAFVPVINTVGVPEARLSVELDVTESVSMKERIGVGACVEDAAVVGANENEE